MTETLYTIYLLLGANLGDRLATVQQAREAIQTDVGPILTQSHLYETAPWGVTDQPAYVNQVLRVLTPLPPEEVLKATQQIEQRLGRVRREKWGSRLIDIDLLYADNLVYQSQTLTVPHPHLHERRFTLVPLTEIAPDVVHPTLQKTSQQLLDACQDGGEVVKLP